MSLAETTWRPGLTEPHAVRDREVASSNLAFPTMPKSLAEEGVARSWCDSRE